MTTRRATCIRGRSHRRAMALLIVLPIIVLACAAMASAVSATQALRTAGSLRVESVTADDLLAEAERPILFWLHRHSARTVLGPEVAAPGLTILEEALPGVEGSDRSLTIVAFDQCGMVAIADVRAASQERRAWARSALSPDVLRSALRAGGSPDSWGLDGLERADGPLFPRHAGDPALGAVLATHGGAGHAARINVATTPRRVLAAAMHAAGAGDQLDEVLRARGRGVLPTLPVPASESGVPTLAIASDCWSFRVDVRVGAVRRSRWVTFEEQGGRWTCAQRLNISEGP